jgi:hypothetical protein
MASLVDQSGPALAVLRPVALDDRRRLPWRFLERHIALDALSLVL